MNDTNKAILVKTFFLLVGIYIMILFIAYTTFRSYAIEENEAKLQDLLMHNKALHTYVEGRLKPVFYRLKEQGELRKDFFDPTVLSFTFMSRNIMDEYNKERIGNNIETIEYKLASKNFRNPINEATKEEIKLLNQFNKGDISKHSKHFTKDGKDYIHYAMPVTKNALSCMRCHGDPKDAPKSLIDFYGESAGFHEKIGDIRAFISVTMPLDVELNKMEALFEIFIVLLFIIFIVIYILIYYFVKELDYKDKILTDRANKDALTKIFNRHLFNKDIDALIESSSKEKKYLIIIDIDYFKQINDTYGHSTGDGVLVELCNTIVKNLRDSDKFYRIGGEEFAIVSWQSTQETAIDFANRIKRSVHKNSFEKIDRLTVSIGVTQQQSNDTYKTLFERADKALYMAKDQGRDRVIFL